MIFECRQNWRDESAALRQGRRGLAEEFDSHMLEVTSLAEQYWLNVWEMTTRKCWVKPNVLPLQLSTDLDATYGRMINSTMDSVTQEFGFLLSKMSLSVNKRDPILSNFLKFWHAKKSIGGIGMKGDPECISEASFAECTCGGWYDGSVAIWWWKLLYWVEQREQW